MGKIVESVSIFDDDDNLIESSTTTRDYCKIKQEPDLLFEDGNCECCDKCDCDEWESGASDLVEATAVLKKAAMVGAAILGGLAVVKLIRRIAR